MIRAAPRVEVGCAICGGNNVRVVAKTRSLYSEDQYRVVRCSACALVYVSPRAPSFEMGYEDSEAAVAYFISKERSDLHERGHYQRVARQIAGMRPRASVLDIGAGTGTFLEVLRQHGLQGTGVEMSRACVDYGVQRHGRRLVQGSIERMTNVAAGSFDVATMIQTLEHVGNPVSTLRAVRQYLKPDGFLYVDVPNYDFAASRIERVLGTNLTKHWDPTGHLYYFTERTLRSVAEAAGYCLLDISTPGPPLLHRMGGGFVGWLADVIFNAVSSGRIVKMFAEPARHPQ